MKVRDYSWLWFVIFSSILTVTSVVAVGAFADGDGVKLAEISDAGLFMADPLPTPSATPSAENPSWKDKVLAHVQLNYLNDSRKASDMDQYEINEDGTISGQNLLDLAHPLEEAMFEQVIQARGQTQPGDFKKMYQQYLQQVTDRSMGLLVLNRILDHEAMKRMLSPEVSDTRVNYVMRSLLVDNAISTNKVPAGQDLSVRSNAEMYAWLRDRVGGQPVRFNINWQYRDGGTGDLLDAANSEEPFDWPPVSLSFEKLPDSWQDFRGQVAEKLQPDYLMLLRSNVWQVLVSEHDSMVAWESLFAVTDAQMKTAYAQMKDSNFKVTDMTATVAEFDVAGAKASDFRAQFDGEIQKTETDLLNQIFATPPASDQDQAKLKGKILELRQTIPNQVYQQIAAKFAADVKSGALKISFTNRSITQKGTDLLPTDNSVASQQLRFAVNPNSLAIALLPEQELVDTHGTIKILFLVNQVAGAPAYLNIQDPRVQNVLKQQIEENVQMGVFKDTALELYRKNPLKLDVDTCSDSMWPCASIDPRHWVDLVFPDSFSKVFEIKDSP